MKWRSLEESAETDLRSLREIYAERKVLIESMCPKRFAKSMLMLWLN